MRNRARFPTELTLAGLLAIAAPSAVRADEIDNPLAVEPLYQVPSEQIDELTLTAPQLRGHAQQSAESDLRREIATLERTVSLSEPQRRKLELAGRIDIARFFAAAEDLKREFPPGSMTRNEIRTLFLRGHKLQGRLSKGLHGSGSLFRKAIPAALDAAQTAKLEASLRDEANRRQQARLRRVRASVEEAIPLTEAQRRRVEELLASQVEPPLSGRSYYDGEARFMKSVAKIPEDDWKKILPDSEWDKMSRLVARFRAQAAAVNLQEDSEQPFE